MKNFKPIKIDYFHKTFETLSYRFKNSPPQWIARDKFMVWEYTYKSVSCERQYTICLNYERGFAPRVWIVEPDFSKLTNLNFPHVYKEKSNMLCLYHPHDFHWHQNKDLIQTIILWSMLWIEFFEIFLKTGKWYGPEANHNDVSNDVSSVPKLTDEYTENNDKKNIKKSQPKTHQPKYLKTFPIRLKHS